MRLAQPLFPPPDGYHWVLHQNVEVFNGTGSPSTLPLPPGWSDDGSTYLSNFEGRATFTNGANFSVAGAATYEMGRPISVQMQTFVDGSPDELMAVGWDDLGVSEASGSRCINVNGGDAFRSYSAPPAVWPEQITITYQTHSHSSSSGSLAVELLRWVGDVWAAEPGADVLPPPPNNDCPPPCSPITGGPTTASAAEAQAVSPQITWPRTNQRVDKAHLAPGLLASLTYGDEWDGALPFVLDGYQLDIIANPAGGGYTQRAAYVFVKPPLTIGLAPGTPLYFTVNLHQTGDVVHPVLA